MLYLIDITFMVYMGLQENALSSHNLKIFMIVLIYNLACIAANTSIKIKMAIIKKRVSEISTTVKDVIKSIDKKNDDKTQ